jgi:hypothetical protein
MVEDDVPFSRLLHVHSKPLGNCCAIDPLLLNPFLSRWGRFFVELGVTNLTSVPERRRDWPRSRIHEQLANDSIT